MRSINIEMSQPLINGRSNISWSFLENIVGADDTGKMENALQENASHSEKVFQPDDAPMGKSSFHLAVETGAYGCLNNLLKSSLKDEFINKPDFDGDTPLHLAARIGELEALTRLINSTAHLNARNDWGNTPLHILADNICRGTGENSTIIQCLDKLLESTKTDLDPRNKRGQTPLMLIAHSIPSVDEGKVDNAILTFSRRLVSKGASLDIVDSSGQTIDEILEEKKAKTPILMCNRQNPPPKPKLSSLLDTLLLDGDISQEKYKNVVKEAANMWVGSDTILKYAIDNYNLKSVKALLDAGANPFYTNKRGENVALHRAFARGHVEILKLLIKYLKKNSNDKLDFSDHSFQLLYSVLANYKHQDELNEGVDYMACLKILLSDSFILNVNQEQNSITRKTALHLAAQLDNQDAIEMLLVAGAHLGARTFNGNEDAGTALPAVRYSTLTNAMNNCITFNSEKKQHENDALDKDYSLVLDYRFLVPEIEKDPKDTRCELETVMDLKRSKEHRRSLTHPLIQVLLYVQWIRILPLYILNLSIYSTFVAFLTFYMYSLKDLRILETRKILNITGYNQEENANIDDDIALYSTRVYIGMAVVLPLTLYMIAREGFQIRHTKIAYLKNIENFLEIYLIVVVLVLSFFNLNVEWTKHLAGWAVIAAGYNLVLILGRVPFLAIYVTMLRSVAWNFLRMIFLYGTLILVFVFSFNILLFPTIPPEKDSDFRTFWTTLPKSLVMATGEFEYSDLSEQFSTNPIFATSTVIMFLEFVFLIFLVVLNIMTGHAVTDTNQIIADATLYSLTSRLELIYLIEVWFRRTPCLRRFGHKLRVFSPGFKHNAIVYLNERKHSSQRVQMNGKTKFEERIRLNNSTWNELRSYWLEKTENEKQNKHTLEKVTARLDSLEKSLEILIKKLN